MESESERGDVRTVSISEETAEWVAVVSKTVDMSEAAVIENCCRHGLADYEGALGLEK